MNFHLLIGGPVFDKQISLLCFVNTIFCNLRGYHQIYLNFQIENLTENIYPVMKNISLSFHSYQLFYKTCLY